MNRSRHHVSPTIFLVSIAILTASVSAAADLPVAVAPDDAHLAYVGRWDMRDAAGPRCEWSGASVSLHFHGVGANVRLKDNGNNYFQIIVDGKPTDVLHPGPGESTSSIAANLPESDHVVQLFRRTEANQGTTQALGFSLSGGARLLDPAKPAHLIEVIGDSISCGYGNEGKSQNDHFTPATENAWLTYGAITARHFDADYSCISWSGRKMWPDYTIPSIYDRLLPNDDRSKCDFEKLPKPDVIVINLATNDFGRGNPDEARWTGAYEEFVKKLRRLYPDAMIYVATGSMMSDGWPKEQKALSTVKSYLKKIMDDLHSAGDKRIAEVDFALQDQKNGLGSDWHPSVKTHEIMAATLETAIAKDLGWKAIEGK